MATSEELKSEIQSTLQLLYSQSANSYTLAPLQVFEKLKSFEESIEIRDEKLLWSIADAYQTLLFRHSKIIGRKDLLVELQKVLVELLDSQKYAIESRVSLIRLLIEEPAIRDLNQALSFSNELRRDGNLPHYVDSQIGRAERWLGICEPKMHCDFSELSVTPAVLDEERKWIRQFLRRRLRQKTIEGKMLSKRLYNLGLYVTFLYGSEDCKRGVVGRDYDFAVSLSKVFATRFNFEYLGKIAGCNFLSSIDYKMIEKMYGVREELPAIRLKDILSESEIKSIARQDYVDRILS